MPDIEKTGGENGCKELWSAFKGVLSWKWDDRFETVLAEFAVKKKNTVRETLERHLPITWDDSNIANATDFVRTINNYLGGLREGQLLLTSDPQGDPLIFCAWWPWGNGKTISIRIAPFYDQSSDLEKAEKARRVKSWFGM
jgi:hypothetical protein